MRQRGAGKEKQVEGLKKARELALCIDVLPGRNGTPQNMLILC